MKRLKCYEWVFVVVTAISLLAVLAFAIERFVYFSTTFENITVVVNNTEQLSTCDKWTCTNDFVFAVVVLVNVCKLLRLSCTLCYHPLDMGCLTMKPETYEIEGVVQCFHFAFCFIVPNFRFQSYFFIQFYIPQFKIQI